jgi:sialate O-acetylesterase
MKNHCRPIATNRPACVLLALLFVGLGATARADVRLPRIFSDHMVLQRDTAVPVWGWADPAEAVTVTIAGQTRTARADQDGKWLVKFDKLAEAGPHTLTVKGKNTLTVSDVLAGEVWLGSGQSNMAMTVNRARDFDKEQPAAKFPQVRMFTVGRNPARAPAADCTGSWQVCSPDTVATFSATAYFFGRELHQKLGVPVGLINSSVGGTPIEAWTSLDVQKGRPELKELFASWDSKAASYNPDEARAAYEKQLATWKVLADKAKAEGKPAPVRPRQPVHPRDDPHHPTVLFNGMIAPLIPYAMRGAIWYQGENNARTAESGALYARQLPLLVNDWRTRWGQGDFPFAWVQLPNFSTGATGWPLVREAMLLSLAVPNTGMTVNIDIGEEKDIHPKNKQDIGHRLALWARAQVYGEKVPWSGPLPAGHQVNGDTIEVRFKHTDGGLVAKGGELRGFTLAGKDGLWRRASARIEGDKVVVSSPEVKEPVAVRYSWAAYPDGNLANGAGLPASPFRTDRE